MRALISCGVTKSCEHTLGKLLTKLHQADMPEMQPLADPRIGHNFKKGQIMHIINSNPKGTMSSMDGNRAKFYKYCVAALSATAADVFQRATC
jgi:hypothetical protein